jgi:hypothetical protein
MRAICVTCGTQYPDSTAPPAHCFICEDERQYVGWKGQQWTTLDELRQTRRNDVREEEPGLVGIGTTPSFAIGQRALLVRSPSANVLWDCISLIDDDTIAAVHELGGIRWIAISHPHFYSSMVEWSHAFDAPILLHAADRQWVARPDPSIEFWDTETRSLHDGLTLIRCGGHFDGGTALHWPDGSGGAGALLVGDILMVGQDRRHVSFMRSYPNLIPLPPSEVRRIVAKLEPFAYDRIWSGWWSSRIWDDAQRAVHRSAERYIRAVTNDG